MRNNSEGRELPPLPYPQIPGLDVSEPATPYQNLVAHLDFMAAVRQVPSRAVSSPEAVLGTEIHEQVAELLRSPVVQMDTAQVEARVAAWRELHPAIAAHWRAASRQRGSATLALIVLVCVAAIGAVLYFGPKEDARLADEIKSCIDAGGEPVVRGTAVRCAIRPMVRS